jgi:hypothetical protein
MVATSSLLLPIFVSAVFVFLGSFVIHMALPFWHKTDYPQLPNEDKVMDALRPLAIPPGDYMMPRGKDMKEMKTPEFDEKMKKGPVMVLTVMANGPWSMGPALAMWFVYSVVISFFSAYITSHALPARANYLEVFRFIGATAFMGYSLGLWQMSIWYKRSWTTTIKSTIDGLVYACLTAGTFGWLWPK